MSGPFEQVLARFWDLRIYCALLANNFGPPDTHGSMLKRAAQFLDPLGLDFLEEEVKRWRGWGLLPEPKQKREDWVALLWQSPLFQGLMSAVSFYPAPEDRYELPPAVRDMDEFGQRRDRYMAGIGEGQMGRGEVKYWQQVLWLQAPELYLDPYLPSRDVLHGCDMACGWGRITLGLRNYENRQILACDLAQPSLDQLLRMAEPMGLLPYIRAERHDIFELPMADNSTDFFLAFDIFEHMTTPMVQRSLRELLRCARPGCVIYAEIPLQARSLALSHIQNWKAHEVIALFTSVEVEGKKLEVALHDARVDEHFSFRVV